MTVGHSPELLADFIRRGADDASADWVPMWIRRDVAMQVVGATDEDLWALDDDELNAALHEHLEMALDEAGK